jgi:long-chain acyl-CoA synthetase
MTHPWIKSYPHGVRWDAEIPVGPVQSILEASVRKFPDHYAFECMGRRTTYRELGELTDRAAAGFQKLGVAPGVHVGLFLPNTLHYVIAFFGILKAGGTVVNYSPLDVAKTLEHKIADSETDLMCTLNVPTLLPQMQALAGKTRLKELVVGEVAESVPFAGLLDNDGTYARHETRADDVAVIQYTGGTTGTPKGAMLTHANLSAACNIVWAEVDGNPKVLIEGEERLLAVLPLFHIYALTINMLLGIRLAAETVLHIRFDPEAAVKDIAAKKLSGFPAVPTMFAAILGVPGVEKYDLTSLKFCGSGGAPLPVELYHQFQKLTGCPLVEGWGMTETSPVGTFTPIIGMRKDGSCGMPVPGVTIKLVSLDDPTKDVALGEKGEMCIKGPNVMKGYWKQPEATAAQMTADGFLRTGDVAYMDADGFVFIVDRCKDMILCGGYNVYPRTIEEAMYEHPSVSEAMVIGVHDPYRGQSPKAFVTLKPGAAAFTLDELKAFLKDRLGKHEMVQALEIRASLPKTPVGKLSKKELYDEETRKRERETA